MTDTQIKARIARLLNAYEEIECECEEMEWADMEEREFGYEREYEAGETVYTTLAWSSEAAEARYDILQSRMGKIRRQIERLQVKLPKEITSTTPARKSLFNRLAQFFKLAR